MFQRTIRSGDDQNVVGGYYVSFVTVCSSTGVGTGAKVMVFSLVTRTGSFHNKYSPIPVTPRVENDERSTGMSEGVTGDVYGLTLVGEGEVSGVSPQAHPSLHQSREMYVGNLWMDPLNSESEVRRSAPPLDSSEILL